MIIMNLKIVHLAVFACVITMSLLSLLCYAQDTSENNRPCFYTDDKNYSITDGDKLIASWDAINMDCSSCERDNFRSNACSDSKRVLLVSNRGGMLKYSFELKQSFNNTYVLIRYSRNYYAPIGVLVYLDDKHIPGGGYTEDTNNWNNFKVLPPILLGNLTAGQHNISISIDRNDWGMEIDVIDVYAGIKTPIIKKYNATIIAMLSNGCFIENAQVLIDGNLAGTTDDRGTIEVQITDGWHNITVNTGTGCTSEWTFNHNSPSPSEKCIICAGQEKRDLNDSESTVQCGVEVNSLCDKALTQYFNAQK